jgi:hypothetical protein
VPKCHSGESPAQDVAWPQVSWSKGQYTCLPNHFIKYHALEVWLHACLTSALDGGHWTATPGRLGGSQSRSERCGEERNLALPEIEN